MSFQSQIEDYVGSFSDTQALTNWLTAGAKIVIDRLPESKSLRFAMEYTDSGSGIDISDSKVIQVHKNGLPSREVMARMKAYITDTNSLYLATTDSPAHYIEAGKIYIKPSGGSILAIVYPSVMYNSSQIANFPSEYTQKVVLYATIQACISKYFASTSEIGALTMDAVTAPTPPTAPSFTYTDATLGSFTSTTIQALGTPPTFPTIALGTYTPTAVGSLGTPPEYTKVTTPVITYTNTETRLTNDDVELANSEMAKLKTQLEEFQMNMYNELNEFNKENSIYQSTVQKAIQDSLLTQERILKEATDTINKNTAQTQLDYQRLLSQIADEKDIKIRQALLNQERILTEASTQTNLNIQNEAQELVKQIQEYQAKLGKYSNELQGYGADIQKAVSKLNGKIQALGQATQFYSDLYTKLKAEYEAII